MNIKPPSCRDQSAAIAQMAMDWPLMSSLIGGTRTMRAAGKMFLPQFPAEADVNYGTRQATSVLTNYFGRTCSIMSSKPFSQAINVTKLSPALQLLSEDIDGQGTELQAFGENVLRGCMSHGIGGVMVDYPEGEAPVTVADEKLARRRPFWSHYPATSIIGFKAKRVGSEWVLAQIRLLEMAVKPDGRFGETAVEQVRVLEPGTWEIWRKDATTEDWLLFEEGATTLDYVPFQFFYGVQTGFGAGVSPLVDLAYLNCEHWQSCSDQQNILHVARIPILFAKGFPIDAEISIGASRAAMADHDHSDLKFVEHSGKAIEAGRTSILDLEERMRQLGAELLTKRKGNVTATQVVSEGDANKCILQSIVENFEDGLNNCLGFTAKWLGEADAGTIELFKDFGVDSLTDASAALLLDAAIAGKISDQTWFEEMRRRTVIDADRTWDGTDGEKALIAAQPKPAPPPEPTMPVATTLPIKPGRSV